MGKFLSDFKAFAMKGNLIDMAVGVIIGGAFGKIVTSLVNDIIMPVFAAFGNAGDFKTLKWVLKKGSDAAAEGQVAVEEVAINYGMFIQNIVDFLIIAFSIFVALRVVMKFKTGRRGTCRRSRALQRREAPHPDPRPPRPRAQKQISLANPLFL